MVNPSVRMAIHRYHSVRSFFGALISVCPAPRHLHLHLWTCDKAWRFRLRFVPLRREATSGGEVRWRAGSLSNQRHRFGGCTKGTASSEHIQDRKDPILLAKHCSKLAEGRPGWTIAPAPQTGFAARAVRTCSLPCQDRDQEVGTEVVAGLQGWRRGEWPPRDELEPASEDQAIGPAREDRRGPGTAE
jgi:hypothetical protein